MAEVRYQPVGWKQSYRDAVKRNLMENQKRELSFGYHVVVTNDEQRSAEEVLIWLMPT